MNNQPLNLFETIRQVGNVSIERNLTGAQWRVVTFGKGFNQYDMFNSFTDACKRFLELTEK
jgi:hypothetical protein